MICGLTYYFEALWSLCSKPSETTMGTQLKITLKYLNYISRRSLVKLTTLTFANVIMTQIITNFLVAGKTANK